MNDQEELLTLIQAMKAWYHCPLPAPPKQVAPPPIKKASPPPPKAEPPEQKSDLALWAEGHFSVKLPLAPILCLDNAPILQKLCTAITERIAPASCTDELPDLKHPLLKLLLVPLPLFGRYPTLQKLCSNPTPHTAVGAILPIHPPETYEKNVDAKRELWNVILKLPLFS